MSQSETCPGCGKEYKRSGIQLCPGCSLSEDRRFGLVREYLRINGGAPMRTVSEETGIPLREIARYTDEGRLIVKDGRVDY